MAGRPRGDSKLATMPSNERDGQNGQWTREYLEQMDAEFCHALEDAIARGREHAPTSNGANVAHVAARSPFS